MGLSINISIEISKSKDRFQAHKQTTCDADGTHCRFAGGTTLLRLFQHYQAADIHACMQALHPIGHQQVKTDLREFTKQHLLQGFLPLQSPRLHFPRGYMIAVIGCLYKTARRIGIVQSLSFMQEILSKNFTLAANHFR
jgi:hypothetical protein